MCTPGDFEIPIRKQEILLKHCEAVGRDPSEISRSVQIASSADQDPSEAAEQAAGLFEAGVDQVIFTLRTSLSGGKSVVSRKGAQGAFLVGHEFGQKESGKDGSSGEVRDGVQNVLTM